MMPFSDFVHLALAWLAITVAMVAIAVLFGMFLDQDDET